MIIIILQIIIYCKFQQVQGKERYIYQVLPSPKLSISQSIQHGLGSTSTSQNLQNKNTSLKTIPLTLLPSIFPSAILFLKLIFCHFKVLGHCGRWCYLFTIICFIPDLTILHYGWKMLGYLTGFGFDHVTLVNGTLVDRTYTIFKQKL